MTFVKKGDLPKSSSFWTALLDSWDLGTLGGKYPDTCYIVAAEEKKALF